MEVNIHIQLLQKSIYVIRYTFEFIDLCKKTFFEILHLYLHLYLQRAFAYSR